MKENFQKALKEQQEMDKFANNLYSRRSACELDKLELEESLAELKARRPQMLADEEDITELTKEIKKLEENISLKEDEVIGIDNKLENINSEREKLLRVTNRAYESYIKSILEQMTKKYNKMAKEFAEFVKDYIVIQELSDPLNSRVYSRCLSLDLSLIPQLGNDKKPFFSSFNRYDQIKEHMPNVIKKYSLIDYRYQPE